VDDFPAPLGPSSATTIILVTHAFLQSSLRYLSIISRTLSRTSSNPYAN